jgi:hypothetical protein
VADAWAGKVLAERHHANNKNITIRKKMFGKLFATANSSLPRSSLCCSELQIHQQGPNGNDVLRGVKIIMLLSDDSIPTTNEHR